MIQQPQRRKWQPTPVFLPGKLHGQKNLEGYSPRGPKESDTTEVTEYEPGQQFQDSKCCHEESWNIQAERGLDIRVCKLKLYRGRYLDM